MLFRSILVAGGEIIMKLAAENRVEIFPIDSEHSAIYQCLEGRKKEDVSKLLLTGSGGPFREYSRDELKKVTKKEALKCPSPDAARLPRYLGRDEGKSLSAPDFPVSGKHGLPSRRRSDRPFAAVQPSYHKQRSG